MGALRRGWAAAVGSFVVVACGPDVAEPLACEGDGPLPLLALDDDERDEGRVGFSVRDGPGWLAVVGDRGLAIECDEVAREFVRDISDGLREVEGADARWLAFRPTPAAIPGVRLALDPWGTRDAIALPGAVVGTLDGALVSVGDADQAVRITSFSSEGESEQREVSFALSVPEESVRVWEQPWLDEPFEPVDRVFGRSFGWIDVPDRAVAIDVRTGEVEVLGTDLAELHVHARGRFVVLVPRDETAPARLLDRETGRAMNVGEPGWSILPGDRDPGLVIARHYDDLLGVRSHVVFLPSFDELWLEGDVESEAYWITDDRRRLLEKEEGLFVVALGDAAPTLLYPGRGPACDVDGDVYLWDHGLEGGQESSIGPWDRLVRIPLDGSPPQVVIEGPLARAVPLSDGRWAITRDWTDTDLLLHDPRTGTEELLAPDIERVFVDPLPQTSWDVCPEWLSADKLHDELRWVARDPEDGTRKLWHFAL